MKWNKKYDYPSSSRSVLKGIRQYTLNNQILPSVTSIISLTKSSSEKEALASWQLRVGKEESMRIKKFYSDSLILNVKKLKRLIFMKKLDFQRILKTLLITIIGK